MILLGSGGRLPPFRPGGHRCLGSWKVSVFNYSADELDAEIRGDFQTARRLAAE
jgi:hypothetical protein